MSCLPIICAFEIAVDSNKKLLVKDPVTIAYIRSCIVVWSAKLVPVCSFVRQLLYLFSELVSFAKERFLKLCRSEIFWQELHFVRIFQIEQAKQGETNFSYTTWGNKLRLSMYLLCPLPPSCSFFLYHPSTRWTLVRGGGIYIIDDTQIFNLCRYDQISSCLGGNLQKIYKLWSRKNHFLLQKEEQTMDAFNLFMIVGCVTPL
jgi:hypothetical protein